MSGITRTQKITTVAAAVTVALAGYSTAEAQLEEIIVTAAKKNTKPARHCRVCASHQ